VLLPPHRRRSLFDYRIVAAYMVGTTAGALATAVAAWLASGFAEPLPRSVRLALLAAGIGFVVLSRAGWLAGVIRIPEAKRQIPAEVFGGSLVRGAFRFGFELGTGLRTYVSSAVPYFVLLIVLIGRPTFANALAIALGFGIGRGLPLAVQLLAPNHVGPFVAAFGERSRVAGLLLGLAVITGGSVLVDLGL
jgi:hypothetical protein